MRLAMALKVRDEVDVIETNLRYHAAQGVDFFIVTDNGSVDGTLDVLRRWEQDGRLRLIDDAPGTYAQDGAEWLTRMARLAAADHSADWVLHTDADEFWWPLRASLREAFATIPGDSGVVVVPRVDFVGRPDSPGAFAERLAVREAKSPIPPKVAHRARADIVVTSNGGHAVDVEAAASGRQGYSGGRAVLKPTQRIHTPAADEDPLVWAGTFPIRILHFPVRSSAQFERRLEIAADGHRRTGRYGELFGRHEREGARGLYADVVLDDAALEAGIADGSLVRDQRLRDYLAWLDDPAADPPAALTGPELEAEQADVDLEARAALGRQQRSLEFSLARSRERERTLGRRLKRSRRALREARRQAPWRGLARRARAVVRR